MGEPSTGIRVLPPLVLLAAFAVAVLAHWLVPFRLGLPAIIRWPVGLALIVLPFAAMPAILAPFRRAGAHYDVRKVPPVLVTDGPFRYSRNPGYLASIVLGVGVGIAFDSGWVLLTTAAYAVVIHITVVLKEEAVLERAFGERYLDYKRRVRRWL